MEDGLVLAKELGRSKTAICLNPYCSGQWSRTHLVLRYSLMRRVLILIVVDNGLVPISDRKEQKAVKGLNPYCSGQWSRTQI